MVENPGLLKNIASSYRSRFNTENLISPRLFENYIIQGKKRLHTVDIYLEFRQMNNREITIMKMIPDRKLVENDIWEFYTVLQDLKFKAKGIIYYEKYNVSKRLIEQANNCNIELKKFDLMDAIRESLIKAIQVMLPDDNIIGDPFWILMEVSKQEGVEKTNGNYIQFETRIPLFISKRQAKLVCDTRNKVNGLKAQVFGLSQNQLKSLVKLLEAQEFPAQLGVALPEFEQPNDGQVALYDIDSKKILKYYYREN